MAHKVKSNRGVKSAEVQAYNLPPVKSGVKLVLSSGAAMYINTGNSQNQGARPYQEDSFGYTNLVDSNIVTSKGLIAILSDGMGGLANGKSVADYVVQASIAMFDSLNPYARISDQLMSIARYINNNVCQKYEAGPTSKAGATMVLAYIFKNRIYWITAGDSRLYCFRNGHLMQMNEDHDYKNRLLREYIVDGGDLQSIEQNRQKDSLVSFIGKKDLPCADVSLRGFRIKPNDTFVLCSDGIYNAISPERMKEILAVNDAQAASDQIVANVVNSNLPGQDNMTVMVIKCEK